MVDVNMVDQEQKEVIFEPSVITLEESELFNPNLQVLLLVQELVNAVPFPGEDDPNWTIITLIPM